MKLSGRKVFVTGCAGFIGSHMVDALLRNDNDVVGVDNLAAGKMVHLNEAHRSKRFKFIPLDLLKKDIAPALNGPATRGPILTRTSRLRSACWKR